MYDHISLICFLISMYMFFYGLFIMFLAPDLMSFIYPDSRSFWILLGLGSFFLYPIVLEIFANLIAWARSPLFSQRSHNHDHLFGKCGIIYNRKYDITACGIEKMHPFDSKKYSRAMGYLRGMRPNILEKEFLECGVCPRELLTPPISKWYLLSLNYSLFLSKYIELPLCFLPGIFIRYRALNPKLRATKGSIEGVCMALDKGWAINMSGGYHHASTHWGGGFCVIPDITLCVYHLRRYHPEISNIMIIDLDAHQGNGYARDLMTDKRTYIVDFYNHGTYPGDGYARGRIDKDVVVTRRMQTLGYLDALKNTLADLGNQIETDFLIYNAGTDCLSGDPIGGLGVSQEGLIERDEMVFQFALGKGVPILMLLSGGYQLINAQVIAQSIDNLAEKLHLDI